MLSRLFGKVFTTWTDETPMWRIARDACGNGYAVVPVKPGGKAPLCTLNAREMKAAGLDHPCSVHHAITDPKEAERVFRRLGKAMPDLNIGIVAHPSRLVVVDADVPEAVEAFRERWAQATSDEGYLEHSPTVRTPGALKDGVWKHHDGGHWYFGVPEDIQLPMWPGQMVLPGGADVRWGMLMTVAPPSRRAEGRYTSWGDMPEVPAWLLHEIRSHIERKIERKVRDAERWHNDSIAAWSMSTPWGDLLEPDGWRDTNKLDRRCGCPVFEKPGGGSSGDRSAIAHENDCDLYENVEGHGALHLFTTDPPEELARWCRDRHTQTLTKLQYLAAVHHDGDELAAEVALGLPDEHSARFRDWFGSDPESTESPKDESPGSDQDPESPPLYTEGPSDSDPQPSPFWLPHEDEEERELIRADAKKQYRRRRAVEYIDYKLNLTAGTEAFTVTPLGAVPQPSIPAIGRRRDLVPLLYRRKVNCVFGQSDHGKSWVTLAFLLDVLRDGGKALVIDVEDDYDGFAGRMAELSITEGAVQYVRLWGPLSTTNRSTLMTMSRGVDLIIVDSFDALLATQGYDSNNATGVRACGALLKQLSLGGAAVLLVDHASEKKDRDVRDQMGSSAKKAFIDGALFFAHRLTPWIRGSECRTLLEIGKDRHGWAKQHALFEKDTSKWGRIAMVRLRPDYPESPTFELDVLNPPGFDVEPSHSVDELLLVEDRMLDYLRSKAGEWCTRTDLYAAGGDKNGRGLQPKAAAHLVEMGAIERREVELRGSRTGVEYRYVAIDEEQ